MFIHYTINYGSPLIEKLGNMQNLVYAQQVPWSNRSAWITYVSLCLVGMYSKSSTVHFSERDGADISGQGYNTVRKALRALTALGLVSCYRADDARDANVYTIWPRCFPPVSVPAASGYVSAALLQFSDLFRRSADGKSPLHLYQHMLFSRTPPSQQSLASSTGMSRSQVSRSLAKLRNIEAVTDGVAVPNYDFQATAELFDVAGRGREQQRRHQEQRARFTHTVIPDDYDTYVHSALWHAKAECLKATAGYTCQRCGQIDILGMEVHHPNYKCLYRETPENTEVLCSECHRREYEGQRNHENAPKLS